MAQFYTGEALADKLTDIIWNAKKELLILSPFIHLDDYCKEVRRMRRAIPIIFCNWDLFILRRAIDERGSNI